MPVSSSIGSRGFDWGIALINGALNGLSDGHRSCSPRHIFARVREGTRSLQVGDLELDDPVDRLALRMPPMISTAAGERAAMLGRYNRAHLGPPETCTPRQLGVAE
jgi:hypothetical protein